MRDGRTACPLFDPYCKALRKTPEINILSILQLHRYYLDEESLDFMPKHKSAEKRDRQNARRNAINTANRTRLRSQMKKLRTMIASGNASQAQALLPKTISLLDKAVQDGVLHQNAAARHKSRLTIHINKLNVK
jgi:small subunit ribosomal protein S20